MPTRPILQRFAQIPWIAHEPLDAERVIDVMPRQVQVAFRPDSPRSQQVVPLTPAATELLNGPDRVAARRFFSGVIDAARGAGAIGSLRGMSLADGDAGFATNVLASNIEAGYLPDSVGTSDRARFLHDFQCVADATRGARAQNTGWLDVGPKVSAGIRELIARGGQVGKDTLDEVSLVLTHELQHTASPPGPDVPQKHVWLEEGIAETLAWWPGAARATLAKVTDVPDRWRDPDPFTVRPDALASPEYRRRNQLVGALVSMAGIVPFNDDGSARPESLEAARTLLQGSHVSGVPRDLARAIARRAGVTDAATVTRMAEVIATIDEHPDGISAVERLIAGST